MSLKIEGHLTSKSSPLAPVSCKLSKQFIVQQHLNAHYKNISNAKSAIDNKCPKSWFKYTNVKDQLRKERLLKSAREHIKPDNAQIQYQNRTFRSEFDDEMKSPSGDRLFTDSIKPLGPRIYKNDVKSKIAQLRCYNPPKKRAITRPMSAPRMSAPVQSSRKDFRDTAAGNREPEFNKIEMDSSLELGSQENHEDLAYLGFCNDITSDILVNNIFTNRGINTLFDEHVSRNRHRLPMDTMLRALDNIRYELRGKLDPGPTDLKNYHESSLDPLVPTRRLIGHNYCETSLDTLVSTDIDNYRENPGPLVPKTRSTRLKNYRESSLDPLGSPVIENYHENPAPLVQAKRPMGFDDYRESSMDTLVSTGIENYEENHERSKPQAISPPLPVVTTTNSFYFTDQNEVYDPRCDDDDVYIKAVKNIEVSPKVSPKYREIDQCTVPQQALQWSLTSSDGIIPKPDNIDQLCEEIYDVRLVDNQPEIREKSITIVKETLKINIDEENPNRNVHFSNDNQIYSAPESEEHSLTDVTSLKPEDSEGDYYDENNDSTCVESSLELNNTFKGESHKENLNETKYEDDFDD